MSTGTDAPPTRAAPAPEGDGPGRTRWRRSAALVALLLAVALGPFVQERTAQPAVRYAQTAALVEQGQLRLDDYREVVGVDRVEHDGHVYSDKGIVQALLAAPAHAMSRAVGAEPATVPRVHGNLGLWWVTLWTAVVPLLGIAWLGVRTVARVIGRHEVTAPLAVCGGTLLLVYGTHLYAHVLTALLGWACWLAVSRDAGGRPVRQAGLAGALGGLAVATEYQLVIVVAVVAVVLARRRDRRAVAAFVAGGAPFAVLVAAYNWAQLGSPLATSYGEKPVHAEDPFIVRAPDPLQLLEVLFGSRGLLVFSPVVALGAWGLVRLARQADPGRREHGIVGLAVLAGFLLLQAAWPNPWGGESSGPRYVIPALPFLIVGVAEVWDVAGRARWLAVRWSAFAMALVVVAGHLVPTGGITVVVHLQGLVDDGPVDTLWTMALGPAGSAVHVATVIAAAWLLVAHCRRVGRVGGEGPSSLAQPAPRPADGGA